MTGIKTEHAGAKNGGGHWGKRADAKKLSNRGRRIADADTVTMSATDRTVERIRKEAAHIISGVVKLRHAEQSKRDDLTTDQKTDFLFKLVVFDGLSRIPRPRGEPNPEGTIEDAYRSGLRFWAQRSAEVITFDEWQEMAQDLYDQFAREPIDAISFLEGLFDGLTTKDGGLIVS